VITDALGIGLKILDRIIPDAGAKAAAQLELMKAQQAGDLAELNAELERSRQQTDVNKVEAASADPFTSRWRPFIGWVCGSALAWHYIGRPFASWLLLMTGADTPIPEVELGDLLVLLCGLLGLGGLRTAEKLKGAAR
jgi:hypothetical protein